jgi:hypothetical protein
VTAVRAPGECIIDEIPTILVHVSELLASHVLTRGSHCEKRPDVAHYRQLFASESGAIRHSWLHRSRAYIRTKDR